VSRTRSTGPLALRVGVLIATAVACARPPADPVARLLAELEAAAEARDASRFASLLSPRFRGEQGIGRDEAVAQLRRYFAAYEHVALEVYGVEAERGEASAQVGCVVEISGRARRLVGLEGLLPPGAVYRFRLEAREEDGEWRVREAGWAVADLPAPASPR
jgi:hypothetical protein